MGIWDRILGRKKNSAEEHSEQNTEKTETEAVKQTEPEEEKKVQQLPDEKAIRTLAARFMPKKLLTEEGQRELINILAAMTEDIRKADFDDAISLLWEKREGFREVNAVGQLAAGLAEKMKKTQLSPDRIDALQGTELLRTWGALDFFGHSLKPEAGSHLLALRDQLVPVMLEKKVITVRQASGLERQVFRCAQREREKAAPEEIAEIRRDIWAELRKLEEVYIAFDEDYQSRFPFIGLDGAVCFFEAIELANLIRNRMADAGDGHFSVKKLPAAQLDVFLSNLRDTGIPALRLFVQGGTCLLSLRESEPMAVNKLPDCSNRALRGLAINTLQFSARINKLNASLRGSEKQKQLTGCMLTARANLCRSLGNGLVYALGPAPYTPGVTLYTAEALKRAQAIREELKLPEESLIAPGDRSLAVYEGKLALRAINLPGSTGLEQSLVTVFTQRDVCEKIRQHYEQSGSGDSVVVVTWDELRTQAESCAGILLDQGALGMPIPVRMFDDVEKFRKSPNPILVQLKEQKPNAEPPTANA